MINFCPMCGAKILRDANFCVKCGLNLNDYQIKLEQLMAKSETETNSNLIVVNEVNDTEINENKELPIPMSEVKEEENQEDTEDYEKDLANEDMSLVSIEDTDWANVEYPIFGDCTIYLDRGLAIYTHYFFFIKNFLSQRSSVMYNKTEDYDDIFQEQMQQFDRELVYFIDEILITKLLLGKGIDYVDTDDFMDVAKKNMLQKVAPLIEAQEIVSMYEKQLGLESSSGGWVGGGFGITGAITGAIKAEVLNVGTDILKYTVQSILGTTKEDKVSKLKEKLFDENDLDYVLPKAFNIIGEELFNDAYNLLINERCCEPYSVDGKRAAAKFKNLGRLIESESVTEYAAINTICNCIELYPLEYKYYEALYELLPNRNTRRILLAIVNSEGTDEHLEDKFAEIDYSVRLKKLKQYTQDPEVLKDIQLVAFNQKELDAIYDLEDIADIDKIFLVSGSFKVPLNFENPDYCNLHYVGLKDVTVTVESKVYVDFDSYGVKFTNVSFDNEYQKIVDNAKIFDEALHELHINKNFEGMLNLLMQAANNGYDDAVNLIGFLYKDSPIINQHGKYSYLAEQWFSKVNPERLHASPFLVATMYRDGDDNVFKKDMDEARKYFMVALKVKYQSKEYFGNVCCCLGDLFEVWHKDFNKAKEFFALSAKKYENYYALYRKELLENDVNINNLKKAAEHGIVEAAYLVGKEYLEGNADKHIQINFKEARKYFEIAEKKDYAPALYELGVMQIEGQGFVKSPRNAALLFDRAQKQNYSPAIVELGICYANGEGVRQDYKKAFQLYHSAAKLDNADGFFNLGMCYYYGLGCDKNPDTAKKFLDVAAKKGSLESKEMIKKLFG